MLHVHTNMLDKEMYQRKQIYSAMFSSMAICSESKQCLLNWDVCCGALLTNPSKTRRWGCPPPVLAHVDMRGMHSISGNQQVWTNGWG